MLLTLLLLTAGTLAVCIATFSLLGSNPDVETTFARHFLLNLLPCFALTLADYGFIRWLHRSRWRRHYGRIFIDWALTTVGGAGLTVLLCAAYGVNYELKILLTFVIWNSIVIFAIEVLLYRRRVADDERALAKAESEVAAYRYEALKNQLNPHFLFNSLNALAALAYEDAERTNLFAKRLSYVYRYLLTTSEQPLVPLADELRFLDAYLYLENVRFGAALNVRIDAPDEAQRLRIVPVTLQTLVENALKHNVCTEQLPLHVTIKVEQSVERPLLLVSNNIQPRHDVSSTGIGLSNLRRRYASLGHTLSVERTATSFSVCVPLTL